AISLVEDHVMLLFLFASIPVVVITQQPAEDNVLVAIDVGCAADDLALLGTIFEFVEPYAGFLQRFEHGLYRFRILLSEFRKEGANFFRMVLPEILGCHRGEPDFVCNGARVPRLADAEAVHLADFHIGHHLSWWHGNQRDLFIRIDSPSAEVVTHPHRMRPWRKGHRESQRLT